jgi:hypothetical protein
MILATDIADALFEAVDATAATFKAWMEQHKAWQWIISADYALRDPSRPGDCFAFTVMPYDKPLSAFEAEVKNTRLRDLKNSRDLSDDQVSWLRDKRQFHFVFPVNRDRKIFFEPGNLPREVAHNCAKVIRDHFLAAGRHPDQLKRVNSLVEMSKSKGFNVGLYTDVTLLALLFPLVTVLIRREQPHSRIFWFSDRDSMTTWGEGVVWDLAMENFGGFSERVGLEYRDALPIIGTPDKSGGVEVMWFDHYIRSADWLAGSMAAWDREKNEWPDNAKYDRMIRDVIAESENSLFLPLSLSDDGVKIRRLVVDRNQ